MPSFGFRSRSDPPPSLPPISPAPDLQEDFHVLLQSLQSSIARVSEEQQRLASMLQSLVTFNRLGIGDPVGSRNKLIKIRQTDQYLNSFNDDNPLISVLVPTHTAPESLWSRALPSVLGQSHTHLEVLIAVNSQNRAVIDEVDKRIKALGDDRVRLVEAWGPSPNEIEWLHGWLASGSLEINASILSARGTWLSPFAHDDELAPNALEMVLAECRKHRLELCYGDVAQIRNGNVFEVHCSDPPRLFHFGLQGSLRHRALNGLDYDLRDAVLNQPNDWGVLQRMRLAGVRIGHLHTVVAKYFPSTITD